MRLFCFPITFKYDILKKPVFRRKKMHCFNLNTQKMPMFSYCKIGFLKIISAQNEFRIGPDSRLGA